jgi:hypothetical protein
VASTVFFTAVHDLLISDIWYSLPPMLLAGAVCGLSVAWTYRWLFEGAAIASWLRYNLLYFATFLLLGMASVLAFEPTSTIATLVEANEPPTELIGQALPLTVAFTGGAAALISTLHGRSWRQFGATLATCTVLVLLLGLNVSVIGLVEITSRSVYLVAELFALIGMLVAGFVSTFVLFERRSFRM